MASMKEEFDKYKEEQKYVQERLTDIQDNYRKYAEGYSQLNFVKEELDIERK